MTTKDKALNSAVKASQERRLWSLKYDLKLDAKLLLTAALIATCAAVIVGFIQILMAGGIQLENSADSPWSYTRYNQMNYLTAISVLGVAAAALLTALKVLAKPQLRKQIVTSLILLSVAATTSVGAFVLSSIAPSTDEVFNTWAQERYGVVVTENPEFTMTDGQIIINQVNNTKVLLHKNSDNSYTLYDESNKSELGHK